MSAVLWTLYGLTSLTAIISRVSGFPLHDGLDGNNNILTHVSQDSNTQLVSHERGSSNIHSGISDGESFHWGHCNCLSTHQREPISPIKRPFGAEALSVVEDRPILIDPNSYNTMKSIGYLPNEKTYASEISKLRSRILLPLANDIAIQQSYQPQRGWNRPKFGCDTECQLDLNRLFGQRLWPLLDDRNKYNGHVLF